jgi:hypothetical protein
MLKILMLIVNPSVNKTRNGSAKYKSMYSFHFCMLFVCLGSIPLRKHRQTDKKK